MRIWIGALILIALLFGCAKKQAEEDDEEANTAAANVEVQEASVQQGPIRQIVPASGTLSALPDRDVKISALVPGRVNELLVVEGDRVASGQVLARLDASTLEDQLKQAKAVLETTRQNEERESKLFERGISAGKDKEEAHKDFVGAQSAYNTAAVQVSRTVIRSPIAGSVVKRFVSVGEQVDGTAANPIVEVANFDPIELVASLSTSYLSSVHEGQTAEIKTDAYPNVSFAGQIAAVLPAVDPATGSATIRIRIPNNNAQLKGGMFASASIIASVHPNALFVPAEALIVSNDQSKVFVVGNGSKVQERAIQTGWREGNKVEIISGVQKGETVVTTGSYGLANGMTVTLQKQRSTASTPQSNENR